MFYVDSRNTSPYYAGKDTYTYPCFIFIYDNWDDFGYKTNFCLYHFSSKNDFQKIGYCKIGTNLLDKNEYCILNVIPSAFEELNSDYCSLGQEEEFYTNLNRIFGKDAIKILKKLKDCSIDYEIVNQFESCNFFSTSLLRSNSSERMLRMGNFLIQGSSINDFFNISLPFVPLYNKEQNININFSFQNSETFFSRRIYCLIGENGVGKTQILNSIIKIGIYINRNSVKLFISAIITMNNPKNNKTVPLLLIVGLQKIIMKTFRL